MKLSFYKMRTDGELGNEKKLITWRGWPLCMASSAYTCILLDNNYHV